MGKFKPSLSVITGRGSPSGVLFVCFALIIVLPACQQVIPPPPGPIPVPTLSGARLAFETIEQSDWPRIGKAYEKRQPELAIIARPEDLDREPLYISPESIEALASLDFERRVGLIVYQGSRPSTGFGVTIREIVKRDTQVVVLADFKTPAPDQAVGDVVTSHFHVVTLERSALKGKVTFVLVEARTHKILVEREVNLGE